MARSEVVEGGIVKSHKRPAPSSVEEELAKPVTTTNSFTIPIAASTTLPAAAPKPVYGPEAVFGPNSNVGILTKRSHHQPTTAVPVSKPIVQRPTAPSNVTNQTAVPHIPMVHLPNNQTVQSSAQTNLTKPGTAKPSVLPQNTTTNVTHTAAALKQNQVAHPQPVQKTVGQVEQKATQVALSNRQTPAQGASQVSVLANLRESNELRRFRSQTEWEIEQAEICQNEVRTNFNPLNQSQEREKEYVIITLNSVIHTLPLYSDGLTLGNLENRKNGKIWYFGKIGEDLKKLAPNVNLRCVRQLKTGNGFGTAPSSTPSRSLTSSPSLTPTSSPSLTPSPSLAPTSDSTPTPDDSNGSSIAWAVGGGLSTALIVGATTAYLKGWWPSWPFGSGDAPTRDAESERSRLLNPDNTANDGDTPNDAGRPDNNVPDQLRRRSTVAPAAIKQPHERPQPVQQQPQQQQQQQGLANKNALLTSALDKLFNDENGDVDTWLIFRSNKNLEVDFKGVTKTIKEHVNSLLSKKVTAASKAAKVSQLPENLIELRELIVELTEHRNRLSLVKSVINTIDNRKHGGWGLNSLSEQCATVLEDLGRKENGIQARISELELREIPEGVNLENLPRNC